MSSFADESSPLTDRERVLLRRLLRSTQDFPAEFKAWLPQELEINPPRLMASSLVGPAVKVVRSIFDVSGDYTPSPGVIAIQLEMIGGGGGGGGVSGGGGAGFAGAGGGGGGGEFVSTYLTNVQPGAHAFTIGGGGAGGAAGANGNFGGDTDFTTLAGELGTVPTAHGAAGGGGSGVINQPDIGGFGGLGGGSGGSVFGGNCLNAVGEKGRDGLIFPAVVSHGGVGGKAAGPYGGGGGDGGFGTGNGSSGEAWGGGGGGAESGGGAGSTTGGNGHAGVIVITEYIAAH